MSGMLKLLISPNRWFLALECAGMFIIYPSVVFLHPTAANVHISLWLFALYCSFILHKTPGFSWRTAWNGTKISARDFKIILLRFFVSTIGIIFLTLMIVPERFFTFPAHRPFFWLIVMLLYPLLSALPQELIFRNFFFRRYTPLFPKEWHLAAASIFVFGFIHVVFHNPVSPLLSWLCGFFLVSSYLVHRSLKWVAIEHALYGDMVFTVGLGIYFLVGHPPI
jgi:hypothetical protein